MRRLFVLPMLLFVLGAVNFPTQHYDGTDSATLFFYRLNNAGLATVFVDGLPVAIADSDPAVTAVRVSPSRHSVWVTLTTINIVPVLVDLKPGEACYLLGERTFMSPFLEQVSKETFEKAVRYDAEWNERGRGK